MLEIHWNDQRQRWYAYQPVRTQAPFRPLGRDVSYVDLGVRCILMAGIEGYGKPRGYDGNPLLSDWWHWNKRIDEARSKLKRCNNKHTSKRLKRLYWIRKRRFRKAIDIYVKDFVERCHISGIGLIMVGDVTGIRDNIEDRGKWVNAMVHNFWSHRYTIERLICTAENFGIKVELVDEYCTSSVCPRCGSRMNDRRGRLFKCKSCGLEAHRDAVGMFNIGLVHGTLSREGAPNWGMTAPEIVKVSSIKAIS